MRPTHRTAAALVAGLAGLALLVAPDPGGAQDDEPTRLAGPERHATAAAVATAGWDRADTAVVATSADFPDALAAGALAAATDAPLLLTGPATLPGATVDALESLEVERVALVGGEAAVGADVAAELAETVDDVERIGGATRYETAAAVARAAADGAASRALVVSGADFPDALTAGALASGDRPVLLAAPDRVPSATADALADLDPDAATLVGGEAALTGEVESAVGDMVDDVERVAGATRYDTAVAMLRRAAAERGGASLVAASGADFPDGLAAGPLAARRDALLTLVPPDALTGALDDALRELDDVDEATVVGGEAAISPSVADAIAAALAGEDPPGPVEVVETEMATGLDAPWDVVFRDNGDVLVTERDSGRVLELDGGGGAAEVHRFDVNDAGEGGLLGLAERPGTGELYAYYTTDVDNRVVRLAEPGGDEAVVRDGIPRGSNHNGGRLAFGPDGKLWVATGDAGDADRARDPRDPAGAILRLEPDGSVPADNPTWGASAPSPVYASGIRNSQGLAWDADVRLWASEFGPNADDEVNVITAGSDYGWPVVTGVAGDPADGFVDPVFVRQPPQASWSGIEVLVDGAIPQWEGDVFAAALRGERLWRLEVDGAEVTGSEVLLDGEHGRLREVAQAPDGSLWVLTNNTDGRGTPRAGDDRILRLGPPGD